MRLHARKVVVLLGVNKYPTAKPAKEIITEKVTIARVEDV